MNTLIPAEVDALERLLSVHSDTPAISWKFSPEAMVWLESNAHLIVPTIRKAWNDKEAILLYGNLP
jgi:hypothetical protein